MLAVLCPQTKYKKTDHNLFIVSNIKLTKNKKLNAKTEYFKHVAPFVFISTVWKIIHQQQRKFKWDTF